MTATRPKRSERRVGKRGGRVPTWVRGIRCGLGTGNGTNRGGSRGQPGPSSEDQGSSRN